MQTIFFKNIYGSLGVSYQAEPSSQSQPFIVPLERSDPVHLFDSHNLELILGELDTVYDLQAYLTAKENAIQRYSHLSYCGEEDLLAHYFVNFDDELKTYIIGKKQQGYDGLMIGEGAWRGFVEIGPYKRRKADNQISYFWDRLISEDGTVRAHGPTRRHS